MKLKNLIEITTSAATGPEVVRMEVKNGMEIKHLNPRVSRLGSVIRRSLSKEDMLGFNKLKKKKKKKKKKKEK